ncbi:MAG: zf-HC2 domain-containing protein [Candidatus Dadabacteria bacterium]|nr:MAG: zf-HC2 domain-containing protein [Candidatus Dadabacteria bacterium]
MKNFTDLQLRVLEKDKIECADFVALLGDYVDRDLSPTLAARLAAHVKSCDFCQEFEDSYRFTVELAGTLKDKPVPVDVQNRLRAGLSKRLGIELPAVK